MAVPITHLIVGAFTPPKRGSRHGAGSPGPSAMTDTNVLSSTADANRAFAAQGPISKPLIYALVALVAIGTAAFHFSGPLSPDVAWLITVSERILAGGRLYIDILEPNPPMAGYLYMPPVLVARALGLSPEPFVVLWTILFGLVSTGFAARDITEHRLLKHAELFWPVALLLVLSAWGEDFAQREHFATMASLPLIVSLALAMMAAAAPAGTSTVDDLLAIALRHSEIQPVRSGADQERWESDGGSPRRPTFAGLSGRSNR